MRYKLVVVGDEIFKISLIKKELSEMPDLEVEHMTLKELKLHRTQEDINLVMLDFSVLEDGLCNDFFVDGLGYDILIFSAPKGSVEEKIMKWKSVKGVLPYTAPIEHLRKSVHHILRGGMWMPRNCLEKMVRYYRHPSVFANTLQLDFTKRERQILSHIANGQSNQQIANDLFLAESTVKTHIYKLYKKMNVHCRHDALEQLKGNDWASL